MTGIEPALSAWEAGEPTVRWCFQAQTWGFEATFGAFFWRSGARGGPEKLIKMATHQLDRRLRHEAAGTTPWAHRERVASSNAAARALCANAFQVRSGQLAKDLGWRA